MVEKSNEVNALKLLALFGGFWLVGVFVGNIIGVLISPNHNVESFSDFFAAFGGWQEIGNFLTGIALLVVSPLSTAKNKQAKV